MQGMFKKFGEMIQEIAKRKPEQEVQAQANQATANEKVSNMGLVGASKQKENAEMLDKTNKDAKLIQELAGSADGSGKKIKDKASKKEKFAAVADAFSKMNKGRQAAIDSVPDMSGYAANMRQESGTDPIEEILKRNKRG
jgi:DNA polymerase sigma